MRPANAVSADGPANLLNGVRVAASPDAIGKGVLIVLNDEINSARDATKTDANRLNTFRAPQLGILGLADPEAVVFYRSSLRRHTADSEFDMNGLESLPRVPIVTDYTGFDGSTIRSAADQGADGLVVTGFPSGLLSGGASHAVVEVASRGIPVVIHSRALAGRTREYYVRSVLDRGATTGSLTGAAIIAGGDRPAHKARILLMLALTRTRDAQVIQRFFDTY